MFSGGKKPVDLIILTEEIVNGKLNFLRSELTLNSKGL